MPTLKAAIDAREARVGAAEFRKATHDIRNDVRETDAHLRRLERTAHLSARALRQMRDPVTGRFGRALKQDVELPALSAAGAVDVLWRSVRRLAVGFTAAFALRQVISTLTEFDTVMRTIGVVTQETSERIDEMRSRARELGATTRYSATEAASGMLELAKAGLTTDEVLQASHATLLFAQAGMIGLGEAADFAAGFMKQFSLSADQMTRIVDSMVVVANKSATDVREMAEGMKFVGPIAAAMGVSIEETAAAMGVLSDRAIKGALAGTGLRMAILRLINPSEEAKRIFQQLRVTEEQVNPAKVGLITAFETLDAALDKHVKSTERASVVTNIFEARSATSALALMEMSHRVRELTTAQENSSGVAKRVADEMEAGLEGAFANLSSAIEEAIHQLGDAGFKRAIQGTVTTLTGALNYLSGTSSSMRDVSFAAQTLARAIQFVTIAFSAWIALRIVSFIYTTVTAVHTLTRAIQLLTAAMARNPFGLLAIAIAAAATALIGFHDWVTSTTEAVNDLDAAMQSAAAATEAFKRSQAAAARAETTGDFTSQLGTVQQRIDALRELSLKLREAGQTKELMRLSVLRSMGLDDQAIGETINALTKQYMKMVREFQQQIKQTPGLADPFQLAGLEKTRYGPTFGALGYGAARDAAGAFADQVGIMALPVQAVVELVERQIAELEKQATQLTDTIAKQSEDVKRAVPGWDAKSAALARVTDAMTDAERAVVDMNFELTKQQLALKMSKDDWEDTNFIIDNAVKFVEAGGQRVGDFALELMGMLEVMRRGREETARANREKEITKRLDDELARAETELQVAQLSGASAQETSRRVIELQAAAAAAGVAIDDEKLKRLGELIAQTEALTAAQRKQAYEEQQAIEQREQAQQDWEGLHVSIQDQVDSLGLYDEALERAVFHQNAMNLATMAGVENADEAVAKLDAMFASYQKQRAIVDTFRDIAVGISDAFGDAFTDVLMNVESAEDAFKSFARVVQRILIESLVTAPLTGFLKGFLGTLFGGLIGFPIGFAKGGVIKRMAHGDVLTRPTMIPLASGQYGLAGEAGTEGVLPLTRTKGGDLGVKAEGLSSRPVHVSVNVYGVRDADSFRKSTRQIAAETGRMMSRAVEERSR